MGSYRSHRERPNLGVSRKANQKWKTNKQIKIGSLDLGRMTPETRLWEDISSRTLRYPKLRVSSWRFSKETEFLLDIPNMDMESKIMGAPILSVILIPLPTLQGSLSHCHKTSLLAWVS